MSMITKKRRLIDSDTEVPSRRSVEEIIDMLRLHNAKGCMVEWDGAGAPISLSFVVATSQGDVPFKLPANIAKVAVLLVSQRARKPESWHHDYAETMQRIQEQAGRVGWRIVREWVRSQMAIIDTNMVTIDQVFLPYMKVDSQRTLYDAMADWHFQLPEGRK